MRQKNLKRGSKRLLSFVLSLAMTFTLMISTSIPVYAMGITVKVVNDNTEYTLDVEPSSTIEDIKNQLVEKTGISVNQQILKYNDKKLEDNRTLADYNIQKDSTLTLETEVSSSSNYHDTYAILVSVPDAWRNSGGAKIWSSDLNINSDQDLEMVDESRCLYGLKYTGTLPDSFKMYIKGNNQQAEITTSKEAAQSKYYYIANGGEWITGSEENPNSLPDLSNLNNPKYKIFALVPSEYANDIGLYSWITGGNGSVGWPGSSMTRLQEDGNGNVLFGGNVNGINETNIIFNGKSTSGSGWQTNDIYNVAPGENEAVYFKLGLDNGNYSSIERIDFKQILPSMITLSDTEYTYDGTEKTPSVTVKDGSNVLTAGTDYTISGTTKATEPGEYTVKITGTRTKYIGSVDVTWKIVKKQEAGTIPDITITDFEIPTSVNMDEVLPNPILSSDMYTAKEGLVVHQFELGWCQEAETGYTFVVNGKNYQYLQGQKPKSNEKYSYVFCIVCTSTKVVEMPETITVKINNKIFTGYIDSQGYYWGTVDLGNLDENGNFSGGDFDEKEDTWNYSVKDNIITSSCNGECGTAGAHTAQLTLSASNATYSGKSYQGASVKNDITSVTGASAGSIKYVGRDGTSYGESTTAPTNAGNYTASVTIGGATATADFEITKANVTKPAGGTNDFTYDGSAKTFIPEGFDSDKCTISGNTATSAKNGYEATVSLKDKTNTCWADGTTDDLTFTYDIKRASQNASVSMSGYNFGQTPASPSVNEAKETPNVTYYYYEDGQTASDSKEWKDITGDTLEPGKYHIYAVLSGTTNYAETTTADTTFEVKGAQMSSDIKADKVKATYDGKSYGIEVSGTLPDGYQIKYGASENDYTLSESPKYTDAGTYTVYYEVTARGYYPVKGFATVTIDQKEAELSWSDDKLTYNGSAQKPTAVVSNLVDKSECTVTVSGTETNTGTYTATASSLSNKNYKLPADATHSFTIAPKTIEIEWSNITFTYDRDSHVPTVTAKNLVKNDTCTISVSGEKTNAGTYTATADSVDNSNYKLPSEKTTSFTINPKALTDKMLSLDSTNREYALTNSSITPVVTVKDGSVVLESGESKDYTLSGDTSAVKYGSHEITVTGHGNYTGTAKINWNITETNAPTGTITLGKNSWNSFLNKITFGHFFKATQSVKVEAADGENESGVDKVYYYVSQKPFTEGSRISEADWNEISNGGTFSIEPKAKVYVYVKITDKAGNNAYLDTDGIVLYTDSAQDTREVKYTKLSNADATAKVSLNGNTISKITVDGKELVKDTDYVLSDDGSTITFKGAYLQSLSAGDHSVAVSYNPMGVNYEDGSDNVKPLDTAIALKVVKTTGTASVTSDISKTYDATAVAAPAYETTNTGNVTVEYKKQGEDTYTAAAPKDSGSYVVRVTVAADDNYNEVSEEKAFTISPKKLTATVSADDKTYDGNTSAVVNATADTGIEGENLKITGLTGTFADKNVAAGKTVAVDSSKTKVSGADDKTLASNYTVSYADQTTASINAKEIGLDWTNVRFTYDEKSHIPTATATGIVGNDECDITVNGEQTNAGSYTATAVAVGNPNYKLPKAVTTEFVIDRADPALSVSAVSDKNYKDDSFSLEVSHKGDGKVTFASSNDKIAAVDANGNVTITGAGKVTMTVSLAQGTNYNAAETFVTFTVKKIDHTLTVTKTTYDVTYGDAPFKVAAKAGDAESNIKFSSSDDKVAAVDADGNVTIKSAGKTTIKVSMDESDNYTAVSNTVEINVASKSVSVTADNASKHVTKADPKLTYTANGLVGNDKLSDITVSRKAGESAGTYVISASQKAGANPNYDITFTNGTFTIEDHDWSDWKEVLAPTATSNGKNESECKICGIKRYESIPATGKPAEEDPSNGKLDKDVQVAPTAPVKEATMTNTKAELLEAPKIFTEEEKTQIKEGKVDAKVWMEINETDEKSIPQETKAQVEKEAEKIMGDQASDIMYFDADLFKQVTNPDTGDVITPKQAIHEPGEHIDVTVKIPEKLLIDESKKSMVREYKIIRIHTDQTTGKDIVDVLDGDFNEETGEFSFATDKFSTYAIAFTDVPVEVSISDNGDNSTITAIGDTKQLTAVVTPDSAARRDVKWTSGNTSVATVDENGVVTAVGNGNAVIRVTVADSDVYAEYTVRVNVPAKDTPSKPSNPGSTGNPAAPVAKPDTKPATPDKDSKTSTKKTAVKTGDENRTWLLIMMMFAGAGMVVFGRKKKENR